MYCENENQYILLSDRAKLYIIKKLVNEIQSPIIYYSLIYDDWCIKLV